MLGASKNFPAIYIFNLPTPPSPSIVILEMGLRGAALSVCLTSMLFTCLLFAYIFHRGLQRQMCQGFSGDALLSWKTYLQLALPGMAMICLQVGGKKRRRRRRRRKRKRWRRSRRRNEEEEEGEEDEEEEEEELNE